MEEWQAVAYLATPMENKTNAFWMLIFFNHRYLLTYESVTVSLTMAVSTAETCLH